MCILPRRARQSGQRTRPGKADRRYPRSPTVEEGLAHPHRTLLPTLQGERKSLAWKNAIGTLGRELARPGLSPRTRLPDRYLHFDVLQILSIRTLDKRTVRRHT